jgi:hypothetical protein
MRFKTNLHKYRKYPQEISHFNLIKEARTIRRGNQFGQVIGCVKRNCIENGIIIVELETNSGNKQVGFFDHMELDPIHFSE